MSLRNAEKYDEMFKFLSQYKFILTADVPDNLKCVKCQRIVTDACQVPCGCRFCRVCIDEFQSNSVTNCPGNNNDCQYESLSDFQLDFICNKNISKLVVQCPESDCVDECKLIDMGDHVKVCQKKSIKCPFHKFGCDTTLTEGRIGEHLQLDVAVHSEFLASAVGSIHESVAKSRQAEQAHQIDIDNLKLDEENNKNEIGILKRDLVEKENQIRSMRDEIGALLTSQEEFTKQLGMMKRGVGGVLANDSDVAALGMTLVCHKTVEKGFLGKTVEKCEKYQMPLNMSKLDSSNGTEMENLNRRFNEKLDEITFKIETRFDKIRKEWKCDIAAAIGNTADGCHVDKVLITSATAMVTEKLPPELKTFHWSVGSLESLNTTSGSSQSDQFSGWIHQYRMQLQLQMHVTNFLIYLRVHSELGKPHLRWPFEADVTINIINVLSVASSNFIRQHCVIDQPTTTSFNTSQPFVFSLYDSNAGKMLSIFNVECVVEFK